MRMKKKIIVGLVIMVVIVLSVFIFTNFKKDNNVTKIGIIQFAKHSSLDDCYKGIIDGLTEGGYINGKNVEVDYKNAFGEQQNSDLIAQNMVQKNMI